MEEDMKKKLKDRERYLKIFKFVSKSELTKMKNHFYDKDFIQQIQRKKIKDLVLYDPEAKTDRSTFVSRRLKNSKVP
jgi:hypothetical protein